MSVHSHLVQSRVARHGGTMKRLRSFLAGILAAVLFSRQEEDAPLGKGEPA